MPKTFKVKFSINDRDGDIVVFESPWSYYKNIKQNTSVAKSPTRTKLTQTNHLFASVLANVKLEGLKFANKMSHFALKTKIYHHALKAAFKELTILKQSAQIVTYSS